MWIKTFELGTPVSETHEMIKTTFGGSAMGRTQYFERLYQSKRGETSAKIVRVQVEPPQAAQMKTWRKFAKSSTKTHIVQFQRSLAG
jgi:hypothetical protein